MNPFFTSEALVMRTAQENGLGLATLEDMKFLLLINIVFWANSVKANTYPLFYYHSGQSIAVENYEGVVRDLKAGNTVVFSDNLRVALGERLGSGKMTAVFEIQNDASHVLKIPIAEEITDPESNKKSYPRHSIQSFINGQAVLVAHRVPVVSIKRSLPGEYLIVEKLEKDSVTFVDFIKSFHKIPEQIKIKAIESLKHFAATTADFEVIGDLHERNLIYQPNKDKWIVMDLDQRHFVLSPNDRARSLVTIFHDLSGAYSEISTETEAKFLDEIIRQGTTAILNQRKQIPNTCTTTLIEN